MASHNPGQFKEGSQWAKDQGRRGGLKSGGKWKKGTAEPRIAGMRGGKK